MAERPRITHVAVLFEGRVYSLPRPARHHDVIMRIAKETGRDHVQPAEDEQGFLVDGRDFARRKTALRVALEAGQCAPDCLGAKLGKLYSEDLW